MDSGPNRNRPFFTNNRLLPTAVPSTSKKTNNQLDKGSLNMNMSVIDEIVIDEQDSDAEPLPKKKALCLDNSKGMMFDFSADPKLQSVRNSVLSIIDPEGKKRNDANFNAAILSSSSKALETVNTTNAKKEKKAKPWERRTPINLNDFRMANGAKVVKEMKQVLPFNENSDESQSDSGGIGNPPPPRRYFSNKNPMGGIATTNLIRKGMEAMSYDGSKEPTGLRAEPSLRHFDEHLISLIESEIMSVTTETGWSDVSGLEGAKKALREIVVLPFKRPDVFTGIRAPPKGVLLFGPPGTGKTMIGKCVASQCKATFFNISASSLTSKWVGEGEKLVRALFSVARLKLPSVIFIDEIDSLLSSRSDSEHESSRRIKTEFLVQLDGVATNSDERLLVLGATNRPQELDEAARRRFAKRLYIALPDEAARLSIVSNLLSSMSHSINETQLKIIAELTAGYSGADMRQLCAEAAMGPIRDIENSSSMDIETVETSDIRDINVEDFIAATHVVRPTVVDDDLKSYEKWDKKFGCLL